MDKRNEYLKPTTLEQRKPMTYKKENTNNDLVHNNYFNLTISPRLGMANSISGKQVKDETERLAIEKVANVDPPLRFAVQNLAAQHFDYQQTIEGKISVAVSKDTVLGVELDGHISQQGNHRISFTPTIQHRIDKDLVLRGGIHTGAIRGLFYGATYKVWENG